MKNKIGSFKKDYFNSTVLTYLNIFFMLILFVLFFNFTKINVFIIFMVLNIIDLYLTNKAIFKRGFNITTEINPLIRLMMRKLGKLWFLPIFLLAMSLFYFSFIIQDLTEIGYIIMGIYTMVVINNFLILRRDELLEKYNLESKYVRKK